MQPRVSVLCWSGPGRFCTWPGPEGVSLRGDWWAGSPRGLVRRFLAGDYPDVRMVLMLGDQGVPHPFLDGAKRYEPLEAGAGGDAHEPLARRRIRPRRFLMCFAVSVSVEGPESVPNPATYCDVCDVTPDSQAGCSEQEC